MSVGFRSGYNNASVTAVTRWFRRKRALAMSIVSVGNGLGGSMALLIAPLVITFGWRPVVFAAGVMIIGIICPLSIFMRDNPESMGLLPDGELPQAENPADSSDRPLRERRPPRIRLHGKRSYDHPNILAHSTLSWIAKYRPLGHEFPLSACNDMVPIW
ncbi:MAG: hypothetical protein CM1200mP35_01330 [Chloroflexota bacterium]|nr:MAG: hypothetical protein CM1200mP35_01330 [Chloroflexota bacterium]